MMNYRIINNTKNSHFEEVCSLLSNSSSAIIASPFISNEVILALEKSIGQLKSLTLVTTFKAKNSDQENKVPVLLSLFSACQGQSIELIIRIDDHLHGKVYAGKKGQNFFGAIISSANCTHNGLSINHEWGVLIKDADNIEQICNQILVETQYGIDRNVLVKMENLISEYGHHSKTTNAGKDIDFYSIAMASHSTGRKTIYRIKPWGTIDCPLTENEIFGDDSFMMTFAKGVGSIKEGDIFILYAVKSRKIISVYVATSEKGVITDFKNERDKRWPYYSICKNVTPAFGTQWYKLNLTLDYLIESFHKQYPNKYIHHSSNTLSVLQWGLDRLMLNEDFSEFVIKETLERINNY